MASTSKPLVRDYMTSTVTTLTDDAHLIDAVLLIRRTGKRHVPIVSAQDGKLAGVISDRDVARLAPSILANHTQDEYNAIFEKTPIVEVMTKNPVTISPGAPIAEAVNVMYSMKIGCILAAEDGMLKGILTVSDMLGLLTELLGDGGTSFAETASGN